jgi:hypothetical protein
MILPRLGLIYSVPGVVCVILSFQERRPKLLRQLGALILLLAAFNVYVEEWRAIGSANFITISVALIVGFLVAYTHWTIQLLKQAGVDRKGFAFRIAFLPIVYALSISVALLLPQIQAMENPPLVIYCFVALICVLHVPAFAFGTSRALGGTDGPLNWVPLKTQSTPVRDVLLALSLPTFASLLLQLATPGDWRLFFLDVTIVFAISILFAIAGGRGRVARS